MNDLQFHVKGLRLLWEVLSYGLGKSFVEILGRESAERKKFSHNEENWKLCYAIGYEEEWKINTIKQGTTNEHNIFQNLKIGDLPKNLTLRKDSV